MILTRCPACGRSVVIAAHYMIKTVSLFEPRPWAPEDEPEPEDLTPSRLAAWRKALPWRLGLMYLLPDKGLTTYDTVQKKATSRPYPHPWWKHHDCPAQKPAA